MRILGPVAVEAAAPFGSRSQRLVLAALAARSGETVSSDVLVDALWGAAPPRTAQHSLRTYVSRLRAVLGDAVTIRPGGYALVLPAGDLDAGRFEALIRQAATAPPGEAVTLLDEALALWRGPAFGDLADHEVVRGAARRLDELRLAAREARARALLRAGEAAGAVAASEELVAEQPLREEAWAVLVEALSAGGRVPEALRAYQRAAAALADAGLEPSDRLRQAEKAALAGSGPPVPEPRRLPVAASSLIGREGDVEALEARLDSARLVTLCGPGGVGKTRLALAVAERRAGRHQWGARLAPLAAIDDPAAVAGAVADALGLSAAGGTPQAALAGGGALDLLVILDNCEHVIEAAARVAEALVTGGDRVRVLATSRERLGVAGEHAFPVAPLAMTGDDSPARRLFLERARAARSDLQVGPEDLKVVDRIVSRLDGLPLAIEMAAARAATLPLADLAGRLDHLDELSSPRRVGEERHRTLGAVVEWSEALLDPDDRALLADLSVFAGPMDEAGVAAVAAHPAPLDGLCRLADRSLLVPDTSGPSARFGMLQTVRDHAARQLAASGRAEVLSRRHAEHVAGLAADADRALRTAGEAEAARRLEELIDDLRAAHRWARASEPPLAVRLSAALHLFAQSRLLDEPLAWAAALAGDGDLDGPGAGTVVASAAQQAVNAGDQRRALALAERGVAVAATPAERLFPLEILSDVHLYSGRLEESEAASRRILADAVEAGDPHGRTQAWINLAAAAAYGGRTEEAERFLAEARLDPPESPSDQGWLAYAEGEVVLDRDPARALAVLDRAVALADSVGNRYLGGVARVSACSLRARVGDPAEALPAFAAVVDHWRRLGAQTHQLTTLRNLVVLLTRVGAAAQAAELLGTVQHDSVAPTFGEEAARLGAARRWATETLGREEAGRRLAAGAARTLDEAALAALEWLPRLARGS